MNTKKSRPSEPEIHLTGSCQASEQPVSPLSSDSRSNTLATQAAGNTRYCYCTRLMSKYINVRFPLKVVKPVILSFPVECVCLQNVEQFCRPTKPKLFVGRKFCMFVTVPVVREPAGTPTFRVLSEGTKQSLSQRTLFRVEIPSSVPHCQYESVSVFYKIQEVFNSKFRLG